jgi:L-lysine exporter family protein LysE/ArgO
MRWGGAAFLVIYGLKSLRAAWTETGALDTGNGAANKACARRFGTALVLTWANPHVYLDTVGLIGAVAATYGAGALAVRQRGARRPRSCSLSCLGYGARALAPVFARPAAWRALDAVVGVTMLALALKLALGA